LKNRNLSPRDKKKAFDADEYATGYGFISENVGFCKGTENTRSQGASQY